MYFYNCESLLILDNLFFSSYLCRFVLCQIGKNVDCYFFEELVGDLTGQNDAGVANANASSSKRLITRSPPQQPPFGQSKIYPEAPPYNSSTTEATINIYEPE